MTDTLLVHCPCCDAALKVDPATGAVLAHEQAAAKDKIASFEEAAAEVARRRGRAQDLFAATVEREKHKTEILEKTFKQALERAQGEPGRPKGIFDSE
jgi:hypothetical protein